MSGSSRAVCGAVTLWLSLTLSACGERSNERLTEAPPVGPGPTAETAGRSDTLAAPTESQPSPSDSRSLRDGPHTAEARTRVAELAGGDARIASEAHRALTRLGRDAVPALVEALEGAPHDLRTKQMVVTILGEMGVAADASLPILKSLKLRGTSELSAMVAPAIYRIEQWQSCGLVGLPEDAEVHLVGLYKGPKRLGLSLGPSGHATTEIDVVVGRSLSPIVLVLSAYDPVVWRVGSTSQSNLAGVLISGYHSQALIGVPRDTPHRILSYEQGQGCEYFYVHNAQTAAQAERRIMALVGRGIDKYYGSSPALVGEVGGDSRLGEVTYSSDLTVEGHSAIRSDPPPGERSVEASEGPARPRRGRFSRH